MLRRDAFPDHALQHVIAAGERLTKRLGLILAAFDFGVPHVYREFLQRSYMFACIGMTRALDLAGKGVDRGVLAVALFKRLVNASVYVRERPDFFG